MPRSPGVIVLRAEALLGQGQPGRARDLLRAARDEQPDQVELWTALALLADRHETHESSLAILQRAQSRLGHRIELSLARIQHWADRGGPDAPRAGRDRARGGEPSQGGPRTAPFEPLRCVATARRRPLGRPGPRAVGAATSAGSDPPLLAIRAGAQEGDDAAMRLALDRLRAIEDDPQTPGETEGALGAAAALVTCSGRLGAVLEARSSRR